MQSGLKVREAARMSEPIANAICKPAAKFNHRALSNWLNGRRSPEADRREILATLFHVPLEELIRHCDGRPEKVELMDPDSILKPVHVRVQNNGRSFRHRLTLKNTIDLTLPAIYQHWSDMFQPWPAALVPHFRSLKFKLFGWIPDKAARPLVQYPQSLVPLDNDKSQLTDVYATDKRVWFIYAPSGQLEVGIAFRDGRWLLLAKHAATDREPQKYPLARIDLIGYAVGRTLFHMEPRSSPGAELRVVA